MHHGRSCWLEKKKGPDAFAPGSIRVYLFFPFHASVTAAAASPARARAGDNGEYVVRVATGVSMVVWDIVVVWAACDPVTVAGVATAGVVVTLVGATPPRYHGAIVGVGLPVMITVCPFPSDAFLFS